MFLKMMDYVSIGMLNHTRSLANPLGMHIIMTLPLAPQLSQLIFPNCILLGTLAVFLALKSQLYRLFIRFDTLQFLVQLG